MFLDRCADAPARPIVALSEQRVSMWIRDQSGLSKIRHDGCQVVGAIAADFIVKRLQDSAYVAIELKGSDLNHAVAQICATVAFIRQHDPHHGAIGAAVVIHRTPAGTYLQKAIALVSRRAGVKLKVFSRSREVPFDALL